MKTKTAIVILLGMVFLSVTLASPALAGSKSRHRWQGIAIGIGTAIVGQALLHHHYAKQKLERFEHRHDGHPKSHRYGKPRRDGHPKNHRYGKHWPGHWEYRRVYVPPTYTTVWNPGHYNRRGRWVPGNWIKVKESDGYWKEERVWVAGR